MMTNTNFLRCETQPRRATLQKAGASFNEYVKEEEFFFYKLCFKILSYKRILTALKFFSLGKRKFNQIQQYTVSPHLQLV